MKKIYISIILTLSSLSAFTQNDTIPYAIVNIYRPQNYVASLMGFELNLTNSIVTDHTFGKIKNNTKMSVKIYNEGKNVISIQTEQTRSAILNVKFGEEYFLKVTVEPGILMVRPGIQVIEKDQGRMDFESIKKLIKQYN